MIRSCCVSLAARLYCYVVFCLFSFIISLSFTGNFVLGEFFVFVS